MATKKSKSERATEILSSLTTREGLEALVCGAVASKRGSAARLLAEAEVEAAFEAGGLKAIAPALFTPSTVKGKASEKHA